MVFRKNEYFWGYKELVNILGGRHKTELLLGLFLGFFLRTILGVLQKFKYFFSMPYISEKCFGVNSRCWVKAYVSRNIDSTVKPVLSSHSKIDTTKDLNDKW